MSKICIFSRPIRRGKTTELMAILPFLGKVDGILCPDRNGIRMGYSIDEKRFFTLQIDANSDEPFIEIGRFYFTEAGFDECRAVLKQTKQKQLDWVIVDEIGKLEYIRNVGLEPELKALIQHHKSTNASSNLMLVVRDFLLEEIIAHYGLEEAEIIHDLNQWKSRNP